jgi:GTP-binding protein Era
MPRPTPQRGPTHAGTVALVGRTNVGKSTLLNAALELPLAIVSRKPQTTRDQLLGVVRHGDAEIALLDTPGLHQARNRLGRAMNLAARDAVRAADVVVVVTALPAQAVQELRPHRDDVALLGTMPRDRPLVLVVNKIDLLRDKRLLLPLLQAFAELRPIDALVPVSALRADGIGRVLDEVARLLPEGEPRHAADTLTDRPLRYFAAEYVREPILAATTEEVPHAVAVAIDRFVEPPGGGMLTIAATIHVERPGQKKILVGHGGQVLKRIGSQARRRIEALTGRQVMLELWVRVTENWRDRPGLLAELGYEPASGPPDRSEPGP